MFTFKVLNLYAVSFFHEISHICHLLLKGLSLSIIQFVPLFNYIYINVYFFNR